MPKPAGTIEVFLPPGELYFGDRYTRIRTLLGSCVSLVLWHPNKHLGGMSHFMLPTRRRGKATETLDGRYGDEALELLLDEIRRSRTRPQDYSLRLFGGGNMFPGVGHGDGHIGAQNIRAAKRLILAHGLQCQAEHVGGVGHRNLIFDVWSGRVAIKHSPPASGALRASSK
ncbi:chemotaxis protein CheD [Stutzerimonas nitrititolerans]|uniref:chemotaxis protein CheD n=1 Tax=Stutzerimonas nitrititolerans TaxID=2482751 RepID=UPI002897B786|nr:chemotaxis protein CheD [Stutzerimonas nitrititolerans]